MQEATNSFDMLETPGFIDGSQQTDPQLMIEISDTPEIDSLPLTRFSDGHSPTENLCHGNLVSMEDLRENAIPPSSSLDLADRIKGIRLLELISEQASNGLVNKIIIAQDHVGRFINSISPGAYASLTKVDFVTLDHFLINPIGVYGSKSEIVRLLLEIKAVSDENAKLLMTPSTPKSVLTLPTLASGLYIFEASFDDHLAKKFYVIYWPEDTTWDDNAAPAVVKNRVTFMRYLTQLTDQTLALISPEHAEALVFKETVPVAANECDGRGDNDDKEEDDHDRLYTFNVAQTNEQCEGATLHVGFELSHNSICAVEYPPQCPLEISSLQPIVVASETQQAFMTVEYKPEESRVRPQSRSMTGIALASLLKTESKNIYLSEELSDAELQVLADLGLRFRFPGAVDAWERRNRDADETLKRHARTQGEEVMKRLQGDRPGLEIALEDLILREVSNLYSPLFEFASDVLRKHELSEIHAFATYLQHLWSALPDIQKLHAQELCNVKLQDFSRHLSYSKLKNRFLIVTHILDTHQDWNIREKGKLIDGILESGALELFFPDRLSVDGKGKGKEKSLISRVYYGIAELIIPSQMRPIEIVHSAQAAVSYQGTSDHVFLDSLPAICDKEPLLLGAATKIRQIVQEEVKAQVAMFVEKCSSQTEDIELHHLNAQFCREAGVDKENGRRSSRLSFLRDIHSTYTSTLGVMLHKVTRAYGDQRSSSKNYDVSFLESAQNPARLCYTLHLLALTGDDKHQLLLGSGHHYVPLPEIRRNNPRFSLPVGEHIRHMQIFEKNRCLLICGDHAGNLKVFLDDVDRLDNILSGNPKATFNHTKLGPDAVFAVDETRGLLVIVSSDGSNTCRLHVFRFMENFSWLVVRGTPMTLHSWHNSPMRITQACFVTGAEEIFLFDDSDCSSRIYSMVTQDYRPAPLQFLIKPLAVFSSPDGACLLAIERENHLCRVRVYHWASFGSTDGIVLDLPDAASTSFGVTSLGERNVVHVLMLSQLHHTCYSASLHISRATSEFLFRAQDERDHPIVIGQQHTRHNSILKCHSEMWTRFPVVPAIGRSTIRSQGRAPTWLQYVTAHRAHHDLFAPYWCDMISSFEKSTRKPVDDLKGRFVKGIDFDPRSSDWRRPSSQFCVGEWLVELFCLIPIQICITRDNRFIPLKDGVWSPDFERSLLGADLTQVVDSLSFGWYESLLQSYYIGREVKVVSSMGQQSVGKSYMINHLTDCSFQGSATRTTEGCWSVHFAKLLAYETVTFHPPCIRMSLTPTDDFLVVSLDFEGLDSVERSAQEDTLLVLFNVAISNLVLFRNNFALSRDLAGSFQSFQSSALVLEPALNPTLFKGKLVIIVKDVIDSDSGEIVKEFSEKFRHIVAQEKDSNFITRLHNGSIDIMPWPVIESERFYTMFAQLKKTLQKQPVTHPRSGVFLSTLKTLMAKLKTNDWGALDQNLASLRAQRLESMLSTALAYGVADCDTKDALKDIDNDNVISAKSDSRAIFYIPGHSTDNDPLEASARLAALRETFVGDHHREKAQWTSDLSSYLNCLGDARIKHVHHWLEVNTSRFASHADITALHRKFQASVVELKAGLQLCKLVCQNCRLLCVDPRQHLGDHTCHTSHACSFACDFCCEGCGLPAGHDSKHICAAAAHLCGEPCDLSEKRGCNGACTKAVGHIDDEHICSARSHQCGLPCALAHIPLHDGNHFTCPGRCTRPCDESHNHHTCEEMSCPISCQLCKRLCCLDHFHGLSDGIHLCGQVHPCGALCSAQGACEISTVPQSVETTFTGKIETFQFTKYSQVVKRLPCVLEIGESALEHDGPHRHSASPEAFHYCEARCANCDYLCTLPYGHTQKEHDTSHGSCYKTQWAIEGPSDAVLELGGHKYGSNDSGAPMLCSLVCSALGRHVHVDYCRAEQGNCHGQQLEHIDAPMLPRPDKPKDYISHPLFWERIGFKDPYTKEEQRDFAKCDHMCGAPEHEATPSGPAQPSYCILPMFHAPQPLAQRPSGQGYVSVNGHAFTCSNPTNGHQAYHVIFVIDRSFSMSNIDRQPQYGSAGTDSIIARGHNNRLGAVYSSLYGFWRARAVALASLADRGGTPPRRDAYSVILFDDRADIVPIVNDLTHSSDQLLDILLPYRAQGGTSFDNAIQQAHSVLETHWSPDRSPVVIFLSDGECWFHNAVLNDLAQKSQTLGKALSFHAVSFGTDCHSHALRRMTDLAAAMSAGVPRDPLSQPAAESCSYTQAIDTIRLAETFLGFAESLQKQRASLLRG